MIKKHFLYCLVAMILTAMSPGCKKGDVGPAGPQGTQGTPGIVGAAGADGSVIYSGSAAPAATLGKNGDYYLNLTTGILYGPKTASGWGTGFSMKGDPGTNGATGATGAAGAAGTKVYSGTGAPAPVLGTIGDFYMDTVAHNLYGPKLTIGWGIAIALQGPTGTANVQYTPWFGPITWSGYNTTNQRFIYFDQPVPAITQAIASSGTVLVYGYLGDYSTDIWPKGTFGLLPLTVGYYVYEPLLFTNTYYEDTWQAWITPGNVRIKIIESPNYDLSRFKGNSTFRVMIIPGGVSIPAGIGYKELKQYLHVNIPD